MTAAARVELLALPGLPEIGPGDDLPALLADAALADDGPGLQEGDVLVVSSKLVSKAMGLRHAWDGDAGAKDALVLSLSRRVVAERATAGGVTRVVEAEAGPVMAAAGVDASNTGSLGGLLLLPDDPDAAARGLRSRLQEVTGRHRLGVVLSDTAGRPWRGGQTDLALGAAGLVVSDDLRGAVDHDGRGLAVTARALADEMAAAADLVKGKAEGMGAVVLRGSPPAWVPVDESAGSSTGARTLVRTGPGDWFALGHVEAVRAALGVPPGTPQAAAVGIRPVHDDGLAARAGRVVRMAARDLGDAELSVEEVREGVEVHVRGGDAFEVGRVVARLEVGAASEDLTARRRRSPQGAVVLLEPD